MTRPSRASPQEVTRFRALEKIGKWFLCMVSLVFFTLWIRSGGGSKKGVNTYVIHRNFQNKTPLMAEITAVVWHCSRFPALFLFETGCHCVAALAGLNFLYSPCWPQTQRVHLPPVLGLKARTTTAGSAEVGGAAAFLPSRFTLPWS